MLANQVDRGQRLQRGDVTTAGQDDVRFSAMVVACPLPNSYPAGAMQNRLVHGEVLEGRLLPGNYHVYIVSASQTMVGHREKAVGIRGQIHADDLRLLIDHVIDE